MPQCVRPLSPHDTWWRCGNDQLKANLRAHLVNFREAYRQDNAYQIVMELCDGGELSDRIAKVGKFSEADTAVIAHRLLGALAALHAINIVHRDVKPRTWPAFTRHRLQGVREH